MDQTLSAPNGVGSLLNVGSVPGSGVFTGFAPGDGAATNNLPSFGESLRQAQRIPGGDGQLGGQQGSGGQKLPESGQLLPAGSAATADVVASFGQDDSSTVTQAAVASTVAVGQREQRQQLEKQLEQQLDQRFKQVSQMRSESADSSDALQVVPQAGEYALQQIDQYRRADLAVAVDSALKQLATADSRTERSAVEQFRTSQPVATMPAQQADGVPAASQARPSSEVKPVAENIQVAPVSTGPGLLPNQQARIDIRAQNPVAKADSSASDPVPPVVSRADYVSAYQDQSAYQESPVATVISEAIAGRATGAAAETGEKQSGEAGRNDATLLTVAPGVVRSGETVVTGQAVAADIQTEQRPAAGIAQAIEQSVTAPASVAPIVEQSVNTRIVEQSANTPVAGQSPERIAGVESTGALSQPMAQPFISSPQALPEHEAGGRSPADKQAGGSTASLLTGSSEQKSPQGVVAMAGQPAVASAAIAQAPVSSVDRNREAVTRNQTDKGGSRTAEGLVLQSQNLAQSQDQSNQAAARHDSSPSQAQSQMQATAASLSGGQLSADSVREQLKAIAADADRSSGGIESAGRVEGRQESQLTSFADSLAAASRGVRPSQESVQLVMPHGVRPGEAAWSQAVNDRVMVMASKNGQFADIQLDPPELGSLHVRLQVKNEQVTVVFNTPHGSVREALEQNMPRLREMFADQGLNLSESSVEDHSNGGQRDGSDSGSGSSFTGYQSDFADDSRVETVVSESLSLVDYYA
ncbi:flagellar hook-length control protein FliK [Amphritea pacifica]|uniref:Flagellar hook-length control protein FliK n=1 Tax=Amphritea pacifica TaxID=2811233 RepID=A0ABS2W536_9GAMM|nr:flagellar hook-length control protein FliK [Amphritea pacifica]MBN0986828.1 flagellar hook-length control protein FliK [Amphritea pacifica]